MLPLAVMYGILVFGDSIVYALGDPRGGWVGRLREMMASQDKYHCVHALGIPGDTAQTLAARMDSECRARIIRRWKKDRFVIIVQVGGNDTAAHTKDGAAHTPPADFTSHISRILSIAHAHTPEVFCIGMVPVDEGRSRPYETAYFSNKTMKDYEHLLQSVCAEQHVPFLDLFDSLQEASWPAQLIDGLHPAAQGHDRIFTKAVEFLRAHHVITPSKMEH